MMKSNVAKLAAMFQPSKSDNTVKRRDRNLRNQTLDSISLHGEVQEETKPRRRHSNLSMFDNDHIDTVLPEGNNVASDATSPSLSKPTEVVVEPTVIQISDSTPPPLPPKPETMVKSESKQSLSSLVTAPPENVASNLTEPSNAKVPNAEATDQKSLDTDDDFYDAIEIEPPSGANVGTLTKPLSKVLKTAPIITNAPPPPPPLPKTLLMKSTGSIPKVKTSKGNVNHSPKVSSTTEKLPDGLMEELKRKLSQQSASSLSLDSVGDRIDTSPISDIDRNMPHSAKTSPILPRKTTTTIRRATSLRARKMPNVAECEILSVGGIPNIDRLSEAVTKADLEKLKVELIKEFDAKMQSIINTIQELQAFRTVL